MIGSTGTMKTKRGEGRLAGLSPLKRRPPDGLDLSQQGGTRLPVQCGH